MLHVEQLFKKVCRYKREKCIKKKVTWKKYLLIIFSIGVLLLLLKRYYIFENRLNELLLVEFTHMNVNFYRMKDKP